MKTAARLTAVETDRPIGDRPDAGVYQLWMKCDGSVHVIVGRLGQFRFPAGLYVYTGRASRGLRARVRRHLDGATTRHWHIDYLLARPEITPVRIVLASVDADEECAVNQAVGRTGECVAPGFGASDCRAVCSTHHWRRQLLKSLENAKTRISAAMRNLR